MPLLQDPSTASLTPRQQRRQERASQFDTLYGGAVDPTAAAGLSVQQKANLYGKLQKRAPLLAKYQVLRRMGGYDTTENALQASALGELRSGATPDLRHGDRPTFDTAATYARQRLTGDYTAQDTPTLGAVSSYVRSRLGSGLTPEEMTAFRGSQTDALEAGVHEGQRHLANRLQASGMGQSGLAYTQAAELERQRAQGRTGIARDLIARELERKRQMEELATKVAEEEMLRRQAIEGLAAGLGSEEEAGRRFDVGATEARRAQVERVLAGLADLGEGRREYDMGFIEAKNQADLNRALMRAALRRAEPSSQEKTASVVGAVFGGLGGS